MKLSNSPEWDEQRRQEALEAHMALFPNCKECGRSMMNCDVAVRIKGKYYCEFCAEVMTNEEMREAEDIE